jgi:hypothetical protein
MELLWILTGGDFDCHIGEIKIYNLIEYDNLENNLKISNFNRKIYTSNIENNDDLLLQEINKELNKGKKFLCKSDIYYNGERLFNYGYYCKKNGEYKYIEFSSQKNKLVQKKIITLLIDNCIYDLP